MDTNKGSQPTATEKSVIVRTQYLENYGAHSKPFTNYWKFKGGRTYLVRNCANPANAVAMVQQMCGKPTPYCMSYVCDWAEYEGQAKIDYDNEKKEWDEFDALYYHPSNAKSDYPFPEIVVDVSE
jgi:hypothetical protein